MGGGGESAHAHNVEGARGERRPCFPRRRSAYQGGLRGQHAAQGAHAGSVTRTLAEAFACELAQVHEQLGEVHESAFLETATGDSVEVLVDGLCPRRAWWWRLFRPRSS